MRYSEADRYHAYTLRSAEVKPMSTIERFHVEQRFSDMAVFGNTIYLAGQVPSDGIHDIKEQTADVLATIDRLLNEGGSSKQSILMATVYLADMADYAGMNEAWDAWVPAGNAPPRAAVEAKLAKPEWRVEIVVVAARI